MTNTAVLGASPKPERYSYQAVELLDQLGHVPYPVHPAAKEVAGKKVYPSLAEIDVDIDTISIYLNPKISSGLTDDILVLKPQRVIFNPGAENPKLESQLASNGVEVIKACTLVMLRTGQF